MLEGLPAGWPNPPSPATLLKSMTGCDLCLLAVDDAAEQVVGLITGLTEGTLVLFVWLLEVREGWQQEGIGSELVRRLLDAAGPIYQVQLITDRKTQPFYERLGLTTDDELLVGMAKIDYERQNGGDHAV
jgi:GNAT superfamily N-acetyltransferase